MDLVLKCKFVKRGVSEKTGNEYLMIGYGDGIIGFVSKDDFYKFEGVQRGDYIDTEVLHFSEGDGIKFFPRDIVESRD